MNNTINSIIDQLLDKLYGYYITVTDFIFARMGSFNLSANVVEDTDMERALTKIIHGPKISVYRYDSKMPNAFTIPGAKISSHPFILQGNMIAGMLSRTPILGPICVCIISGINLLMNIDVVHTLVTTSDKSEAPDLLPNDNIPMDIPTKGNVNLSNKGIVVFYSSSMKNFLDENELIAILLHEVGHNAQIAMTIIQVIVNGICGSLILKLGLQSYFQNKQQHINDPNDNPYSFSFAQVLLIFIAIQYIIMYFARRNEIRADTFAIKAGYGKYLYSAIQKANNTMYDFDCKEVGEIERYNFLDNILRMINVLFMKVYNYAQMIKLSPYLSRREREGYISDTTKEHEKLQIK